MRINRLIASALLAVSLAACSTLSGDSAAQKAMEFDSKFKAGEQAYTAGNFDVAERLFLEAIELNPVNAPCFYRLGTISYRKGDTQKAAGYFESVVKIDPRHSKAHFNLATIRLMQAESHFKYYIATVDPKADIEKLSILIGAIEEYASSDKNK